MAEISVIIPCFNTNPQYLQEAVGSVHKYTGPHKVEIIIIDDGSTNNDTMFVLQQYEKQSINLKVLYQENKGPAAARNTGAKNALGEYILFLDSDNCIYAEYINEGIMALESNNKAAVAFGKPVFIGNSRQGEFVTGRFDIVQLIADNYIDMCSVVRKTAWENVTGLDEHADIIGHEDWEFFISLYKAKWEFVFIDKFLFQYRLREDSLITLATQKKSKAIEYIYTKHWEIVHKSLTKLYVTNLIYQRDKQRPFRSLFKYLKMKYLH